MNPFSPTFSGSVTIGSPVGEFFERLHKRVEAGLLTGKPHWRAQYVVTRHSDRELTFRAATWATAINVGLNNVDLRFEADHRLDYVVSYRRWAASALLFTVALGALIGFGLIACYLWLPGMSRDVDEKGGAIIFWGSVVFWGFIWPWLLCALLVPLHKRFARLLLVRLIDEVDKQVGRVACVGPSGE
jgi:hypothetical protein